mmetsp:Transcript_1712/g.3602  ORF Transcript_1712/g.3602 Transcript_1712/m.3602 type:complete len:124 (-) Transcript_1712:142-513(-)
MGANETMELEVTVGVVRKMTMESVLKVAGEVQAGPAEASAGLEEVMKRDTSCSHNTRMKRTFSALDHQTHIYRLAVIAFDAQGTAVLMLTSRLERRREGDGPPPRVKAKEVLDLWQAGLVGRE